MTASTLPMNGLTARRTLDELDLAPGDTLAVTGSAGAYGGYVIQLAKADGLRVVQYNEAPAGQSVFHLHFHLMPVYEGKPFGDHGQGRAGDVELAALARDIAALL